LPIIQEDEDGSAEVVFETCPYYYFDPKTQSGVDAKRIHSAMDWKKKGQFMVVEEPFHKVIQAIEVMESGFSAAETRMAEKRRQEVEDNMKKFSGPGGHERVE
jgi:hypothetical protein